MQVSRIWVIAILIVSSTNEPPTLTRVGGSFVLDTQNLLETNHLKKTLITCNLSHIEKTCITRMNHYSAD